MTPVKLAMCNFVTDVDRLRNTALAHGFSGVDWTFKLEDLPTNDVEESRLIKRVSRLHPIEVRYHCAFEGIDLGDADPSKAEAATEIFRRACRLISKLHGRFMTVHVGLGRDSSLDLSWEGSLQALADLVSYGTGLDVCVCLENLASGWSSRPELFEKLVRKSGAGVTLDIGHARVSPSVETKHYVYEDFILPHYDRVFNAHVYHEELEEGHLPPEKLDDLRDRLDLLRCLPCDWWVLELREESALLSTLKIVHEFLDSMPEELTCPLSQVGK